MSVTDASTIFGGRFGYRLSHDAGEKRVDLEILRPPAANVRFVYACRFGSEVAAASVDGADVPVNGRNINLPAGAQHATVRYED